MLIVKKKPASIEGKQAEVAAGTERQAKETASTGMQPASRGSLRGKRGGQPTLGGRQRGKL